MRRRYIPAVLACALPIGGCAYIGFAPAVIDAINSTRGGGYVGEDFEAAAAEACSARASRYGRLTLGDVQRLSDKVVRVAGSVQDATRQRAFICDFQSSGRISSFRIERRT